MSTPGPTVKANYDAVIQELQGNMPVHKAMTTPKLPMAEMEGLLSMMQYDANHRLVQFFTGAKLQYGHDIFAKYAGYVSDSLAEKVTIQGDSRTRAVEEGVNIGRQVKAIVESIMSAVTAAAVQKAGGSGADTGLMAQVKQAAMNLAKEAFGAKFVAQAAPIVGLIPGAYGALKANVQAVQGIAKSVYSARYATAVKSGSPRAAADAVHTILERKAGYLTTHAVTANANLAASIATVATTGAFAAGETAIKIATAIVDLIAEISMVCIEIYEHAIGEQLLSELNVPHEHLADQARVDSLFLTIYNGCPLLGCYMLSAAPFFNTSDFVTLSAGPGQLASMDEISRIATENVNPLRLYASQIIKESKLKLTHRDPVFQKIMQEAEFRAKAKEESSFFNRAKKKVKQFFTRRIGKSKAAPDPAWKSNIQGYGHSSTGGFGYS